MRGQLNLHVKELEAEKDLREAMMTVAKRPPPYIDVFEVYSGSSKFTTRCSKFGLTALEPIDILHGPQHDMTKPANRQTVKTAATRFKPRFIMLGLDCRLYSMFNHNMNFSGREDLWQQLQHEQELAVELAYFQLTNDRYFMIENPQRSQLWCHPAVQELSLESHTGDISRYRPWPQDLQTNDLGQLPGLIGRRLTPEARSECTPIAGRMTQTAWLIPYSSSSVT